MKAIISVNNKYYIGKDGKMMWKSSDDLSHFRKMTLQSHKGNRIPKVLVGHNTFVNLPKLDGREVIVDDRYEIIDTSKIDWVIGGAKTYEKYKHLISEWHISLIDDNQDGDTIYVPYVTQKQRVYHYNFDTDDKPVYKNKEFEAIYTGKNTLFLKKGDKYKLTLEKSKYSGHNVIIENSGGMKQKHCNVTKEMIMKKWVDAKEYSERPKETTDKEFFDKVTSSLSDLLAYKNKLYGNSVLSPLNIFEGKAKAGIAIDTKLARVKNSDTLRKNDVADLLGYLILVCKENGWDNFSEFKD